MKISVNDEEIVFQKYDFPMLIHGKAFTQSGASFFSVSLMTKFFENGEKIVFFTALPPAKELFKEQLNGRMNENIIIIPTGDEEEFIKELDTIKDLEERIVLFKNIEDYSEKLFDKLKDHKYTIFSGDIDKCEFKEQLAKMDFQTKIFFSYPEKIEINNKIELPKYKGMIISPKYNGMISL